MEFFDNLEKKFTKEDCELVKNLYNHVTSFYAKRGLYNCEFALCIANNIMQNEIIDKNPEYKKAVMYEATSGEKKFGKDSDSCANCIFVWDDIKPERSKFYSNIEKYIEEHMNANFLISYKSAGEYSSLSLRIIISK